MPSSVLFWNIWGHRKPPGIHEYITQYRDTLDICCLTEVTSMERPYNPVPRVHSSTDRTEPPSCIDGRQQLIKGFGEHFTIVYASPYFSSWLCKVTGETYDEVGFGSALLIKKGLRTIATGSIPILLNAPDKRGRILQYVAYEAAGTRYLVVHLHGVWLHHNTKGDDPLRDCQSQIVLQNIGSLAQVYDASRIVFGGDLNLDMNTRAIATLERGLEKDVPFRNLIRERAIQNTRTPAYRKFGMPGESRFADYVFVSPNVQVHDFMVDTSIDASDHAPIRLVVS